MCVSSFDSFDPINVLYCTFLYIFTFTSFDSFDPINVLHCVTSLIVIFSHGMHSVTRQGFTVLTMRQWMWMQR